MSSALAILEAESPKRVFQHLHGEQLPVEMLRRSGFTQAAQTENMESWTKLIDADSYWTVRFDKDKEGQWWWFVGRLEAATNNNLEGWNGSGRAELASHLRKLKIAEAEDPKAVFKKAVTVPQPPRDLLQNVMAKRSKYLRKQCNSTTIATNPHGETFCYGWFGGGPRKNQTVSTLLVYDKRQMSWQVAYGLTGHDFQEPHRQQLEAESPKRVMQSLPHDPWAFVLHKDADREAYGVQLLHRGKQVDWHPPFYPGDPDTPVNPKSYAEELGDFWVDWYKKLDKVHPYNPMQEEFHHWYETAYRMYHRKTSVGEAEDPKGFLKAKSNDPDERVRNVMRRAHFTRTAFSDKFERWERSVQMRPFKEFAVAEVTRYLFHGNYVWEFVVHRGKVISWQTEQRDADWMANFLRHQYFHPNTKEPFPPDEEYPPGWQAVGEAEDPKAVFRKITAISAPSRDRGKEVGGAWLRTLCSRYPVDGVYIWDNKGPALRPADPVPLPRRYDGILQINFHNYGLIRQEWASFGVLAGALLRWRNLEGAALWINGQPRGKVGRRHPQLKEFEDAAYRPAGHVFGAQAEAEDPKAFLKRLSAKATAEVSFGFAIHTSDQQYIEAVAQEIGVALTQENWDALNEDMMAMERNCLEILNKSGIRVREEGHDGTGDLVGSAWTNLGTPSWDIVKRWADSDGQLLSCASEIESAMPSARELLWRNVSELGKSLLDAQISFFAIEELLGEARKPVPAPPPGRENPKDIFRRVSSSNYAQTKAYQDVLQYMPQEFKDAYLAKKFFEWEQDDVSFADEWPTYDDDDAEAGHNPWSNKIYYFNYYTEDGKIYLMSMEIDRDGNREVCEDAEIGTPDAARIEKDYGHEGWKKQMITYWEWVREHGEDPLNYIHTPTIETKQEWIVGFVQDGGKLHLAALRQLTDKKPSPPAVSWPEAKAKAATDPAWKEAVDYCLVNDEGVTEATEEDITKEGGTKDKKGRLVLRFAITSKKPGENAREHIIAQAEDAIRELQAPAPA